MIAMTIDMRGAGAWPELEGKEHIDVREVVKVAVLDGGMKSGRPSVAIRFDLPDGRTAIAQVTARQFCLAAKMIMDKYPDLFKD